MAGSKVVASKKTGGGRNGTPAQRAFCQQILMGKGEIEAWRIATGNQRVSDHVASVKAARMRKSKWVHANLPEMQAQAAVRDGVSVHRLSKFLLRVMDEGTMEYTIQQKKGPKVIVKVVAPDIRMKAVTTLAKMYGLFSPRKAKRTVYFNLNFAGDKPGDKKGKG